MLKNCYRTIRYLFDIVAQKVCKSICLGKEHSLLRRVKNTFLPPAFSFARYFFLWTGRFCYAAAF
jgi:hypothetical protein